MNPFRCVLLLVPLLLLFSAGPASADEPLREQLRHRLEVLSEPGKLVAGGELLYAPMVLQELYLRRGWRPVWFVDVDGAEPSPSLSQVVDAIDLAFVYGLEPAHYHRARLVELLEQVGDGHPADFERRMGIDIELLASDALLTLAQHLSHGRVDPETIDPEWFISRESTVLLDRLAEAARGQNLGIRAILESILPSHSEYRALVERLALQRQIAGSGAWPTIKSGPLLRPGERDGRVQAIRQRLTLLGDLEYSEVVHPTDDHDRYDAMLERAVVRFQQRHGLGADGVVGPRTLAALNVSPQSRIDQLRANLERWRWLPRTLGDEYIIVNIAGFSMSVVSGNETLMQQPVVVGAPYRRTPVFTGRMSYLVLNPSWEVPHKLAVQDQLPRIREDAAYLDEMGFSLLQGWGTEERRIDPAGIDWAALSTRNFPYRLRQAPGPKNALGRVKFMFPNPHSVYLHDTPSRGLFSQEDRALSSGCIRLEQPDRLMYWLLSERSLIMTAERVEAIRESGQETTVRLGRPIPVHLLYWTAWVDDSGTVQYRNDIYQRDLRLIEALNSDAPRGVVVDTPRLSSISNTRP